MKSRALFLLGTVLAVGLLFCSCSIFSVPEIPRPNLAPPAASNPLGVGSTAPATGPDGKPMELPSLDGVRKALAEARRLYSEGAAQLATLKARVDTLEREEKEASRRATGDQIVMWGWWVFMVGVIGSIVGVVCIAKQYGLGGWWVLLGGASTAVLGLCMVWLGPYWVGFVRWFLILTVLAMLAGGRWAWKHRKKLLQDRAVSCSPGS